MSINRYSCMYIIRDAVPRPASLWSAGSRVPPGPPLFMRMPTLLSGTGLDCQVTSKVLTDFHAKKSSQRAKQLENWKLPTCKRSPQAIGMTLLPHAFPAPPQTDSVLCSSLVLVAASMFPPNFIYSYLNS